MIKIVSVTLVIAFSSIGVVATDAPKTAVQASDVATDSNLNTIVCRRISAAGTHFKRKVCMTKRQWKEQADATQAALGYETDRFEARQSPATGN